MGDSISEGVVEKFVKHPGDFVNADEVIARIETDKVTVDITAPVSGILKQYFAKEGDTVSVGSDFYQLDTDGKAGSAPVTPTPAPSKPCAPEPKKAAE